MTSTMASKIGKCLRLLASSSDGEKLASIGALVRTLATVGLDINDLADAAELGLAKPLERASKAAFSNLDKTVWIRNNKSGSLKSNEHDFIVKIIRLLAHNCVLSEKQLRWLNAIYLAMGGGND